MFIKINGVKLFYKKLGSGRPLIMLHGNSGTHKIFKRTVSFLQKHFTVYAIDLRDHGNSSKVSELHYKDHARDIYEFIRRLNIKKPVYYGFSDGGIVGLMLASKYSKLFSKLIISAPNINSRGIKSYIRFFLKIAYKISKSEKIRMMLDEPDIPVADLAKIETPTYITGGSFDIIKVEHLRLIRKNIKNCALKIFKNHTHSSYVVNSDVIGKYIVEVCTVLKSNKC